MVSVGELAMVVNVGVLITVAVATRAIELIVRNFAKSRLHRTKRAPVVHDSDTWLPNIPRSIVKYHRHPAILTAVLCIVFLIASELVTELGVEVTEKCKPVVKNGTVIDQRDAEDSNRTPGELGAIAFFVHTVNFLDGDLDRVTSGMPKKLTGRECLPCLYERNLPDIARNCRIRLDKVYKANELMVGVQTTNQAFGTITVGFRETSGDRVEFMGYGDLTGNGANRAIFVFAYRPGQESSKELLYFEYGSQSHANNLKEKAKEKAKSAKNGGEHDEPVWENTISHVHVWAIQCDTNELKPEDFQEAVQVYRTIQLENPTQLVEFDEKKECFQNITADNVYRAILSLKIIVDNNSSGLYYEYTSCARYKWKFLVPIVTCLTIIMSLGLLSSVLAARYTPSDIPYNSRSWFRHCQKATAASRRSVSTASKSGYFDSLYEEMLLVDGGNGEEQRILFRSRSAQISELPGSRRTTDLTVETSEQSFERLEPKFPDSRRTSDLTVETPEQSFERLEPKFDEGPKFDQRYDEY